MLRGLIPLNKGLRRSLRVVRYEYRRQRLHRASLKKAKAYLEHRDLHLNIGCGSLIKKGWVNIDLAPDADLHLDLREPLPFADSSAAHIYSEHFFEHLGFPKEAHFFLKECLRVLQPGGRFDIGVPDTAWPLQSYVENAPEYFALARRQFHPRWCDTKMHHLNFHFRQGEEHKYAYDEETLVRVLSKAGFEEVKRREWDGELDSPSRKVGTLYVSAIRPRLRQQHQNRPGFA